MCVRAEPVDDTDGLHSGSPAACVYCGSELTEVQKAHVARVRLPGELKHGVHHERGRHHGAAGASEEAAQRDDGGHRFGT